MYSTYHEKWSLSIIIVYLEDQGFVKPTCVYAVPFQTLRDRLTGKMDPEAQNFGTKPFKYLASMRQRYLSNT